MDRIYVISSTYWDYEGGGNEIKFITLDEDLANTKFNEIATRFLKEENEKFTELTVREDFIGYTRQNGDCGRGIILENHPYEEEIY